MKLITGKYIRLRLKEHESDPALLPLIEGMIDPDVQIQPNGIDLTVGSIEQFESAHAVIDFDNSRRVLPTRAKVACDSTGMYHLFGGCSYVIKYNERVNLPDDVFGFARTRSSLLRSGMSVSTGLWDSGYCGRSESLLTLHADTMHAKLCVNARVAQLVLFQLDEPVDVGYKGDYQGE